MDRATGRTRFIGLCGVIFFLSLLLAGPGGAQTFFTEVTEETLMFSRPAFFSQGTTWGDYDNDGRPDIFYVGRMEKRVVLWHQEGEGRFMDRTTTIQSELPQQWKGWGHIFGDYDNDGDLDLFVPVGPHMHSHRDVLLPNDRGVFRDVALEAGLTDSMPSGQAIWLDYDRDGHLDLYVGHIMYYITDPEARTAFPGAEPWDPDTSAARAVRNHLYRNNGDGTFAGVTEEAGLNVQFHPDFGGSTGGIAAGDFNDDGWPDLYYSVWHARNRLFLNDSQGGFRDATTSVIADPGAAYGVAVGDIDNDGDLDIFQPAGVVFKEGEVYNSLLLLNEGDGQFLDATRGAGLSEVLAKANVAGAGLADIDNDGDLDLMAGGGYRETDRFFLYLNNGDGTFVDRTSQSGITWDVMGSVSLADYDLDGFLDVLFAAGGYTRDTKFGGLYRNNGNDNHWLRVELVGIESNRNGIGARLIATSGDVQQMREILGGLGMYANELVAHFGLGGHAQVDRLEIRWPSGQVDLLRDIPADRKIRVIEGREEYHVITPTVWEHTLPDSSVAGTTVTAKATVRPALFEAGAEIVSVTADLSQLGGSSSVPLRDMGDGTYQLDSTTLVVDGPIGWKDVSVLIEQETSLGSHWIHLMKSVAVVSGMDVVIYAEGPGAGWRIEASSTADSDPYATHVVHSGSNAHAITLQRPGEKIPGSVTYTFDEGVDPSWYTHLSFWIYPGEADIESLYVDIGGRIGVFPTPFDRSVALDLVGDLGLELRGDRWIEVWIPVEDLRVLPEVYLPLDRGLSERMPYLRLGGQATGTFYLDDLKLVAVKLPEPTVVEVSEEMALPERYALSQNYPNPFNPKTIIRYQVPEAGAVRLSLYNISGQLIRRLVDGAHPAGSYAIMWDGRNDDGRNVASGVYLCRMEARGYSAVRKLVLMR